MPESEFQRDRLTHADICALAGTVLGWTLLALVIDPRGDFPLIDDWAYGLQVKMLVEQGSIRFTDWNTATGIAQVGWGCVFCLPEGFSFTAIRLSTLTLGLVGLVSLYLLMRQVGASPAISLIGAWVLGANPVFLGLSYTFMTDVPCLALMTLAVFFLVRCLDRGSDHDLWLGLGFALIAMFIRQIAVAIFLGFLLAYPFRRGIGREWVLHAVIPALVAFAALKGFERVLSATDRLPMLYYLANDALAAALGDLAHLRLGVLKLAALKGLKIFVYVNLFVLPFSLLLWPSWLARLSSRQRAVHLIGAGGLTIAVTMVLSALGLQLPTFLQGGFVYNFGVGERFLAGTWPEGLPRWISVAMTALAVLGSFVGFRGLVEVFRVIRHPPADSAEVSRRSRLIFLVTTCIFFGGPPALAYVALYERYILVWMPIAMVLIWEGLGAGVATHAEPRLRLNPFGGTVALIAIAGSLAFSVAGTHDYLNWNRARWAAGTFLIRDSGIPPAEIEGGFEFNSYFLNLEGINLSHAERRARKIPYEVSFLLGRHLDRRYLIAVSPLSGHEILRRFPLSPWLPLAPREILVLRKSERPAPEG